MSKPIIEMTYKEFCEWCNDRACDGCWGLEEAILCVNIAEKINSYEVKGIFGFKSKKKTEELQEKIWKDTIKKLFDL